jgi:UDP-GlcNAc:undecaprenyl-phosphate/decaprenyl-phosphate GlcNAc-1-phosphate transferase
MFDFLNLYGLMFIISLVGTVVLVVPCSKVALYLGIVDEPGGHKNHKEITPLLGGLAIFLTIFLVMVYFTTQSDRLLSILIGSLVLVIVGLLDDAYSLKAMIKLTGQTAAAVSVVLLNPGNFVLFLNYFEGIGIPGGFAYILIIGWIVLMINALNLIDGLDGLAAGTAAIIFIALAAVNYLIWGSTGMLILQVIAAGACIGFLFYNFPPARVFMGDTGSMLLGFLLATSYLFSLRGIYGGAIVLGSLFIFAYPALDTTFAVMRRLYHRASIFGADRGHIHHVLAALGYTPRKTVLILYLLSIFFAFIGGVLIYFEVQTTEIIAIGAITFAGTMIFYRQLALISRRNGLHLTG